ncbi:MAG TPA: hypothetical protein VEH10_03315 [Thermoplasmata archaeon]|nr:hypothetical protein [Thermoplasmata archaeon]
MTAGTAPAAGPHPGTLDVYEPGYPDSVDPAVEYETIGIGVIDNVYQALVSYNGNSTASFVPALATCVPGTSQCRTDYGSSLIVNGTGALANQPEYWTFVLDPSARFYDPGTGGSWGVYPSDVMFSIARDLVWADPRGTGPGWIVGQALLPAGNPSWDHDLHAPYNTTPADILGSMLVNDSHYCPLSAPGVFAGHGCITLVADGGGVAWPYLLELVAEVFGTGIVPCGWFTSESAGLPGWSGTTAPHGDGSCRLPDGGTTTNDSSWTTYLASLAPTSWDTVAKLTTTAWPAPQPNVQFRMVGSGPYYEAALNASAGYTLEANPAYAAPSGCSGAGGLARYTGACDPAAGTYIGNVSVTWEPAGNLTGGLSAAENGTADFSVVGEPDTAAWVALENSGKATVAEFPTELLNSFNLNLNWSPSAYSEDGLPGSPSIPADFFSAPAARNILVQSYPYSAIENSVWTTDGIQLQYKTGGPIPKDMAPYSASIYPPTGNVSFPDGSPDPIPTDTGGAGWWWSQGRTPSSPYYDPELLNCTPSTPCTFPVVVAAGSPQSAVALTDFLQSIEVITGYAIVPYPLALTFPTLIDYATSGPSQNPLPAYALGWAPDYADPTDYFMPYAVPDSFYAAADALNESLSLPAYDNVGACGHGTATFANLAYWAEHGPISSACEGVAYGVARVWMSTAASLSNQTTRIVEYNLLTRLLNDLGLYIWSGQDNEVVGLGPWINLTSVNTNPILGGSGDQPWFDLRYGNASSSATSSTPVGASPGTPLYDPENGDVYVPNAGSASVSVLSGTTDQVLTTIAVGSGPGTPVLDPANGEVYVANFASANVSVIDGTTNLVLTSVPVGTGPCTPVYDRRSGVMFVANNGSNDVSVLNTSSDTVVRTVPVLAEPSSPALDAANGELYVPDYGPGDVSVLNGTTFVLVTTVPVGSGPQAPVYDPSNGDIYVPNSLSNNVSVIWGTTNKVVATILVGTVPFGPRGSAGPALFSRTTSPRPPPLYDPSNGDVYVVNAGSSNVSVVSGSRNAVLTSVNVGADPQAAVLDPGNGNIYIANNGSANVSVVDGSTNAVVASIPTGPNPAPPAVDNASGKLILPNTGANNVSYVVSNYYLTFQETGLPAGATWHLVVGPAASPLASLFSRTTVPVGERNGTYPYIIVGPAGYRVGPGLAPVGHLTVAGADAVEVVHFVPGKTYAASFHESGLPKGAPWCATVGWVVCTTKASIAFANLSPAQYPYSVAPVPGFLLTIHRGGGAYTVPPGGQVNITSHGVGVKAKFVPVDYALAFEETGLAAGKSWSVRVQYTYFGRTVTKRASTKGSTITLEVPNGTFAYTVLPVKGYTGNAAGTVSIAGTPVTVSFVFTKS